MIFIENPSTNPWFNLAAEEYLLKNHNEEFLLIWRSDSSVVVGKHQVPVAEANLKFLEKNNIPIIRRTSGGGTVFHDHNNINFTVITNQEKPEINFVKHTKPIIDFLQSIGLNAKFEGKNDIKINGFKVSGNSAHINKHKILYHGTLLFDSKLELLESALSNSNAKIESKAIKSNRSKVANISDLLHPAISIEDFQSKLTKYLLKYFLVTTEKNFTDIEKTLINKLSEEKYKSNEWNYCYSPDYYYRNEHVFEGRKIEYAFYVKKGVMTSFDYIKGDLSVNCQAFFESLEGCKHVPDEIIKHFSLFQKKIPPAKSCNITAEDCLSAFF
ncbi:MAG: biotin/lipoate A/B protein ligase family protein [Bacteroidales bacterium]